MGPELLIGFILGAAGATLAFWVGWRARGDAIRARGGVIGRPPLILNEGRNLPRGSNPPPPGTKPQPPSGPPCGCGEITQAQWGAMRTPFSEGRTVRGNGNGGPGIAKSPIVPKPQFPPPRRIREDFLP